MSAQGGKIKLTGNVTTWNARDTGGNRGMVGGRGVLGPGCGIARQLSLGSNHDRVSTGTSLVFPHMGEQ